MHYGAAPNLPEAYRSVTEGVRIGPNVDTIESLKPVAAIAGHKRPGAPDTPDNIEATRKYIRDFDRTASHTQTAVELYKQMLTLYPEQINPAVLWNSSIAIKPEG